MGYPTLAQAAPALMAGTHERAFIRYETEDLLVILELLRGER